jgi:putative transposase
VFPQAAWQRCVVHWYRNGFSHVPRAKMREVALMLKAIHAQESPRAAEAKAAAVAAELERMKLSKLAELDDDESCRDARVPGLSQRALAAHPHQ